MSLASRCLNILAKENVIKLYKNNLDLIPVNLKALLLTLLCKRGLIKDSFIFSQLINARVTSLDLSESQVTDALLCSIVVCKFLQKLNLGLSRRQSRQITSKCLKSLFKHFKYLKILNLPFCKEVNDEVIKEIIQNCIYLQELYIPDCSITDNSVNLISHHLQNMHSLNISGNEITDIGVQHLVAGYTCLSLMELSIKDTNISSAGIAQITRKLKNLKIFNFGSLGSDLATTWSTPDFSSNVKQIFWVI